MLGYTKDDDDYKYGVGDPKEMDKLRDQKQSQKEAEEKTDDLPHLKISIPKPAPEMPPMMPEEEEEEPMMDDQFNEGQQFGAMTGMPDMGNLSLGAATGTMPAPGGMLATGEPMEDAWSTLLKEDDDLPDMTNFKNPGKQSDAYMDYYMEHIFDQGWPLIPYTELSEKQKMIIDMIHSAPSSYFTDPASGSPKDGGSFETNAYQNLFSPDRHHLYSDEDYDEYARYLKHYFDASAAVEKLPHDVQMQIMRNIFYAHDMKQKDPNFDVTPYTDDSQHPLHPDTIARKKMAEEFEHWNVDDPHTENYYRYAPSSFDRANFNESTGFTMSEPMEDAWSTLMKSRIDDMGSSKDKSWKQPQYEIAAGGSQQQTANTRRAKLYARFLKPSKKRGLERTHYSVHRSHLGDKTKQPMRLFPRQYDQQMGTMQRRKLMGNVPVMPAGHAMGAESAYNPKSPSMAASAGLPIKEPRAPRLRGQALAKSELQLIKSELEEIKKKKDYMQFAQIRRLLRQLKDAAERQERRLKAASQGGHGKNREVGHREGQDSTTRPEGATEDMENDPKNWGAPSTMFAARGSGRVG